MIKYEKYEINFGRGNMDQISIVVPMAITDNLPVGVSLPKKSGG